MNLDHWVRKAEEVIREGITDHVQSHGRTSHCILRL